MKPKGTKDILFVRLSICPTWCFVLLSIMPWLGSWTLVLGLLLYVYRSSVSFVTVEWFLPNVVFWTFLYNLGIWILIYGYWMSRYTQVSLLLQLIILTIHLYLMCNLRWKINHLLKMCFGEIIVYYYQGIQFSIVSFSIAEK